MSKYGFFSGPYFPLFTHDKGKLQAGKDSIFGHFLRLTQCLAYGSNQN